MFPDLDLFQGYGMTENCGLLTCLGPEEHRRGGDLLRSAGRPMPGSVVSIQDDAGEILPAGESGEVCAQAGNYMREYWNRPEETAAAFRDGWYHTGDAGYLDADGYLYLVDRVKDMIVTGGENVYSAEVENAIASHPGVAQVAVIGIPSEQWGEAVLAIVVPKPGADAHRGGHQGLVPGADRRLQGAEVGRVPHRAAAALGRHEGPQARAARPLLGGPRPGRRSSGRPASGKSTADRWRGSVWSSAPAARPGAPSTPGCWPPWRRRPAGIPGPRTSSSARRPGR